MRLAVGLSVGHRSDSVLGIRLRDEHTDHFGHGLHAITRQFTPDSLLRCTMRALNIAMSAPWHQRSGPHHERHKEIKSRRTIQILSPHFGSPRRVNI